MTVARSEPTRLQVVDSRPRARESAGSRGDGGTGPRGASKVALVSLTTFCNAHCTFCCVLDILNKPELNPSDELIRDLIHQGRTDGCNTLAFTGGEPTVHPKFAEFCRLGRAAGYESITINTNGIQFKSRKWTEEALAAGLSHIDFSIHGHTEELHDRLVDRPGAFAAIVRGCEHLRELGPKYGAVLGATVVVTAVNVMHLPEIAARLIELGFTSLRFKHCFEGDTGADITLVGRYQEMMTAVRAAVALCWDRHVSVQLTHFPLCLMNEEVVFATDVTDENVLSFTREGGVLYDGRASQYRRTDSGPCTGCLLSDMCAKLDHRYIAVQGEQEVRPFSHPDELTQFFSKAIAHYDIGDYRRQPIRERLEARGAQLNLPTRPATAARGNRGARTTSVSLSAECNHRCGVCDCHNSPSPAGPDGIPVAVHDGGDQLILRGESALSPTFDATLDAARAAAWSSIWVRTNGELFATDEAAVALHQRGVRGAIVPLFSHASAVHDRLAGKPGALVAAMRALQALSAAGLELSLEVPILSPRLQDLAALVRLARRAAPSLSAVRFFSPRSPQPAPFTPPRWSEARAGLERAFAACRELGIQVLVAIADGVPRCALASAAADAPRGPDALYALDAGRPIERRAGYVSPPICDSCSVHSFCLGVTEAYAAAHGAADLIPFSSAGIPPTAHDVVNSSDDTGASPGTTDSRSLR